MVSTVIVDVPERVLLVSENIDGVSCRGSEYNIIGGNSNEKDGDISLIDGTGRFSGHRYMSYETVNNTPSLNGVSSICGSAGGAWGMHYIFRLLL